MLWTSEFFTLMLVEMKQFYQKHQRIKNKWSTKTSEYHSNQEPQFSSFLVVMFFLFGTRKKEMFKSLPAWGHGLLLLHDVHMAQPQKHTGLEFWKWTILHHGKLLRKSLENEELRNILDTIVYGFFFAKLT